MCQPPVFGAVCGRFDDHSRKTDGYSRTEKRPTVFTDERGRGHCEDTVSFVTRVVDVFYVARLPENPLSVTEVPAHLEELQSGGDDALAAVFDEFRDQLDRIVDLRINPRLASRVDPADVLQESFLEARKKLPRYLKNTTVPVFVWLRGVVLDTLIHVHRRHLAQMRHAGRDVSIDTRPAVANVSSMSTAGWLVDDLTSPSQVAIRGETAKSLEDALNGMDEIDREVLILRHFEQLSNDEVASILGVKKAATSRRYMRALKRFRETLEQIPGFDA